MGKVSYDWGDNPTLAPTAKRVDPLGWLLASLVVALAIALAVASLLWRPIPGVDAPPGSLSVHVKFGAEALAHWFWPGVFASDVREYSRWLSLLGPDALWAAMWRLEVACVFACVSPLLLWGSYMVPRDSLIHLRGSLRFEGMDAHRTLCREMAARNKRSPDHEIAPGIGYPGDMWTRHVLVVGGVGSGKSTAMKPLIKKVVEARERLILFDPKGEFTKGFGQPSLIAPWDARSCSWDIGKDMRNIGDMRRFAAAMIKEGQDPMWANASRQILVGFMIYLSATRGSDWGWSELADLLAIPQGNLLPIMSRYHPEAIRAVERASVTTHGILINLASFCAPIFDLAEAWGAAPPERRISFVEWTLGGGAHPQVILQGHGAYPELTKGYVEGIVGVVSALVNSVEMDDDPERKLWFIADELGQMGKIPIRPLFEVGRSRGVRCVVACQDLAQLEEIHGAQMVKALVSMSGSILVGQMMQGDTAEQMSKALGAREVERANLSSSYAGAGGSSNKSTTLSFARDEMATYKPAELALRLGKTPDGAGVKLVLFTEGHAYELFWPMFAMGKARKAHVPAKWTTAAGRVAARDSVVAAPVPSTPPVKVMAAADSADCLRDDGERREDAERGKSLDGDAASRPARASMAAPPLEEEMAQLMRDSLEVVSRPGPAVARAGETHEPLAEAATHAAVSALGFAPLASVASVAAAADLALDARPGPVDEVRQTQQLRALLTSAAVSRHIANASTAPKSSK